MKTDKLEQFILDNKEGFGPSEAAPNVWGKIKKREPAKKQLKVNWQFIMSRAAAVVVIFISSYYFHEYRASLGSEEIDTNGPSIAESDPLYKELLEAEHYYTSQIKYKKNELFSLTQDAPTLQKDVTRDLTELDAIFKDLKSDLKDNADNQEVIEAMIQNYMLRLEILEDMLNQIKPSQEQNDDHETGYSI
jgi:hypothetical protein